MKENLAVDTLKMAIVKNEAIIKRA